MAIVDVRSKTVTLKIVYYGCALGGKTTNLETLQRLTDPENAGGLVSIATKDDRTLFFDLLPIDLGQVGGMTVKAKVYTVPGQVHYELTRRQVLGGADGVVMVVDSTADEEIAKANAWAFQNLAYNLKANAIDPVSTPLVVQWNKRDLPNARPVTELEAELNAVGRTTVEAVAITGPGVAETFGEVLKQAIAHVYRKSGHSPESVERVAATVDEALAQARSRAKPQADAPAERAFDQRFDMDAYRESTGRDKRIVDEGALLGESVRANMELAEKLESYEQQQKIGDRRARMMQALAQLAPGLADSKVAGLPPGALQNLLAGASREHASLLLFKPRQQVMEECEVIPAGQQDPLNFPIAGDEVSSVAYRLSQNAGIRVVTNVADEVFFGEVPPAATGIAGALVAPLRCDGASFGALFVYSRVCEDGFDEIEMEYWQAVATLMGLSLHWRALRRKIQQARAS